MCVCVWYGRIQKMIECEIGEGQLCVGFIDVEKAFE